MTLLLNLLSKLLSPEMEIFHKPLIKRSSLIGPIIPHLKRFVKYFHIRATKVPFLKSPLKLLCYCVGPTCDALAVGVGVVSIDVEAVAHPAVGRQPRAESEHGEELKIRIIISCIF